MKIEVRIEAQLEDLWAQLGLSEDDQDQAYQGLNQQVQELFRNFLKSVYDHVQEVKAEAEQTEDEVEAHIKRFDIIVNGSLDKTLPYLQRLRNAKKRLEALQKATAEQQAEFDEAYNALSVCYQKLEITPPASFTSKSMDYGMDKIDQMNQKVDEYNEEIEKRQEQVDNYIHELAIINRDLGLPPEPTPDTLGDQTIERLEQLLAERREKRDENIEDAAALTTEIRRLERVLGTRQQTPSNIPIVSDTVISKLKERLVSLDREKEARLPEFVDAMKEELQGLLEDLHIPMPTKTEFPFLYQKQPTKRSLKALESEVARLEKVKRQVAPLLNLIARRQAILNSQSDGSTMRGRVSTTELPRIHAEMITELEKYEATYGEPFLWDGEDLLEEVKRMHKSERVAAARSKQQSAARFKSNRTMNLSEREPFYLQQFM